MRADFRLSVLKATFGRIQGFRRVGEPEVVEVDDSLCMAVRRGDDEGGDFFFFHEGECGGG